MLHSRLDFNPLIYLTIACLVILFATLTPNASRAGKANKVQLTPFHHKATLACFLAPCDKSAAKIRSVLIDTVGNVSLFIPFGFLTAMATTRKQRATWRQMAIPFAVGLLFSVCIELAQFWLPSRVTTLDDIILNSSGALMGAVLLAGGQAAQTYLMGRLIPAPRYRALLANPHSQDPTSARA